MTRVCAMTPAVIRAGDVLIADGGTSYASAGLDLPPDCTFVSQLIWGSIGYSVGSLLGTLAAAPDRRHLLFVGDGSFQLTAQEVSTILRHDYKPVIFLINNGGYLIERCYLAPQDRDPQPTLVVRAGSPAALLRLVPHLLGFVPEASLVVIGVALPRDRIRVTLRYDLPDPPEPDLAAEIAAHALGVLSAQRLTAAVAVGYGPEPLVAPVAREVREAAWQAGIDLKEFLRVADGRYWSYVCGNEKCCPAEGVPFDATAADPAEAEALAAVGDRVLAGRAAVAARVAPLGGIAAESMRQATRRAEQHVARLLAKVRKSARLGAARQMIAAEGLAAVGAIIARYRDGGRFTTDDEIARITVALRDLRVRDDAWARMDPGHSGAHQRLWTNVVRRAQPGYVAAPAALLALASSR